MYYDDENNETLKQKIDLDELYNKKKEHNLVTLGTFNKLLNRIHTRIKTISRQKINDAFCWFHVPEIIYGSPKYNHGECIAYLIDCLTENGFQVKFYAPNILFISWDHWVPSYVRDEIKKKTGYVLDGYGTIIKRPDEDEHNRLLSTALPSYEQQPQQQQMQQQNKEIKSYRPVENYKPSGVFVYKDDMFAQMEKKLL